SNVAGNGRQVKVESFPKRVQNEVDAQLLWAELECQRNAVRIFAPVGLVEFCPVPGVNGLFEEVVQADAIFFVVHGSDSSTSEEQTHEPQHVGVRFEQIPIEPV